MYINRNRTQLKRVLIVNKFYYRRGGDCTYMLNLERMLQDRGHDTAVFAMQYPENIASSWSGYFPKEVLFKGGFGNKLKALGRILGMDDVKSRFKRLLEDFKPDVVHLNNIHSYLSPVIAGMAKEYGAKVVWTLHDYKLICPSYSCLNGGEVCEACFSDPKAVVSRRCMKGSLAASAVAYVEARRWNRDLLEKNVDAFICPSRFMADKMAQCGFDKSKLHVVHNFIPEKTPASIEYAVRGDYYCYVGRLSPEKGVDTLLRAASGIPQKLLVAGGGPMFEDLKERYRDVHHIVFLGKLSGESVAELLRQARFSVVPSEWYENNPFSIIESLCAGTPVLGADIGGIPELIDSGNGLLYPHGDADTLTEKIVAMDGMSADGAFDYSGIRGRALEKFAAETHYRALLKIY